MTEIIRFYKYSRKTEQELIDEELSGAMTNSLSKLFNTPIEVIRTLATKKLSNLQNDDKDGYLSLFSAAHAAAAHIERVMLGTHSNGLNNFLETLFDAVALAEGKYNNIDVNNFNPVGQSKHFMQKVEETND